MNNIQIRIIYTNKLYQISVIPSTPHNSSILLIKTYLWTAGIYCLHEFGEKILCKIRTNLTWLDANEPKAIKRGNKLRIAPNVLSMLQVQND